MNESEKRVKEVYPEAACIWTSRGWRVLVGNFKTGVVKEIGRTSSAHVPEAEAWADAASRLPKAEAAICPKCHKPHYNMEDTAMCAAAVLIKEEAMPIKKFRKKPVVIEAIRWTGENRSELLTFCSDAIWSCADGLSIKTLEGRMYAAEGDWIIKGVKGEFYPCKPDIFTATYEAWDDAALRLPKAEAVAPCWCDGHGTDLCPLHRTKCIECGQELPVSLLGSDVARPAAEPVPQAFETETLEPWKVDPETPDDRVEASRMHLAFNGSNHEAAVRFSRDAVHARRMLLEACAISRRLSEEIVELRKQCDAAKASSPVVDGGECEYLRGFNDCRERAMRIVDESEGYLSRIEALQPHIKDVRGKGGNTDGQ